MIMCQEYKVFMNMHVMPCMYDRALGKALSNHLSCVFDRNDAP